MTRLNHSDSSRNRSVHPTYIVCLRRFWSFSAPCFLHVPLALGAPFGFMSALDDAAMVKVGVCGKISIVWLISFLLSLHLKLEGQQSGNNSIHYSVYIFYMPKTKTSILVRQLSLRWKLLNVAAKWLLGFMVQLTINVSVNQLLVPLQRSPQKAKNHVMHTPKYQQNWNHER